ncbi:MAG TPA: hypothetical protein VKP14_07845 [Gaiellaceae bacterium]|nr:hypothetical protein [Gaiellaceae bacterium]
MDEALAVLARLDRIDELKAELLGEVRELIREAEVWARIEGDARAQAAVAALTGYPGSSVVPALTCR